MLRAKSFKLKVAPPPPHVFSVQMWKDVYKKLHHVEICWK